MIWDLPSTMMLKNPGILQVI